MTNLIFLIPDVLSKILEQVDYTDADGEPHWLPDFYRRWGPRTLTRCLVVNRLWFNEASRILWRELASLSYLTRVNNTARRQHYAKMIKTLTVNNRYEAHERFRFGRLDSLDIKVAKCHPLKNLLSLLVPTLKHVAIIGPSIECIEKLERDCPRIESLYLFIGALKTEDLERVKRYFLVVRAVRVDLPGSYSDILLPALARNECVQELAGVTINKRALSSVRKECTMHPFKNLKILTCGDRCSVRVRDLLDVVPNLECIAIDKCCDQEPIQIRERLNDVLQFASVRLKRICMHVGATRVRRSLLLALADKFRHLESVQLYSLRPSYSSRDPSQLLDDEFAHEFTSRLPNLRALELEFHESLSAEGLISIGKNCQHLELLDLYGYVKSKQFTWRRRVLFNFPRFRVEKEPLFPRLICLVPVEKLKHLPRSMQEYHFPRIFAQWEHWHFVVDKEDLRMEWRKQRLYLR